MTGEVYLLAKSDLDPLPHLLSMWLIIIECWTRAFSDDLIPDWTFSIQMLNLEHEITAAMFIIEVIGVWGKKKKKEVECFLQMSTILVRVSVLGIFCFGLCALKVVLFSPLICKIKLYLRGMYTWHSVSHQEMWMFHRLLLPWKHLLKIQQLKVYKQNTETLYKLCLIILNMVKELLCIHISIFFHKLIMFYCIPSIIKGNKLLSYFY